jgi:hypothetical protein
MHAQGKGGRYEQAGFDFYLASLVVQDSSTPFFVTHKQRIEVSVSCFVRADAAHNRIGRNGPAAILLSVNPELHHAKSHWIKIARLKCRT